MVREYRRQLRRLKQLEGYRAIVTHSTYMRDEYVKHDFDPARVYCLSYYAHQRSKPAALDEEVKFSETSPASFVQPTPLTKISKGNGAAGYRLLFLGRMDRLKGGDVFIEALPSVRESLDRDLHVTFAGDGRMRKLWQRQALRMQEQTKGLKIHFAGWVEGSRRESLWNDCDLLVVPSIWPEPFGLVGTEAGLRGVPIAAFAVGGITDWLNEGVNGYLASGDPPIASGLAEAITRCLHDSETHARLRRGALAMAREFNVKNHLSLLLEVFETAVHGA